MKSLLLILVMAIGSRFCFAQQDSTSVVSSDSTQSKSTLTIAAVYSNNASYYGQRAAINIPYGAIAVNYQHKSGFYLTGQTYKILNEKTSSVSAANLGAGFNFKIGKKFSTDLSYNHTFYPSYSPLLQAGNPDNASITLSFPAWVTTSVTGDYAFGNTTDAFVTAGISKSINLFSTCSKDIFTVSPSANVVGGTQHFYQTYVKEQKLRDSILDILTDPLFGNSGSNRTDSVATTSFNFLTFNFKIPLDYNRAHYVLEAAYQLSALGDKVQSGAGKVNSFLTFSFYYQF